MVLLLAAGGAVAYRWKTDAAASLVPAATATPPPPSAGVPSAAVSRSPRPVTGKINPDLDNLSLQAICTASGVEDDAWQPKFACDGDQTSRWSSAFEDKQWLRADLRRRWELTTVTVTWERSYAVSYRVETSLDGKAWQKLYATAKGKGGSVTIPANGRVARYVRMFGLKRVNQSGYSLRELEIR
ncbi:hypothetical protein GCM10010168_92660 [Actinoplanes ianthinogenes]|uniref:F5/8 type C domain-containing protein n=1 Tax=Actinoplanes ianthinogenes TaxID=122358 RepID=A0ABM7LJY9_9ACTN|nr:hypothetical protein Aiant_02120 [Actinoplanes ianthinogenes]GGR59161.1 hypothetical protein GCM10010168_92660 [Actinoplanes ianthinogenes]